MYEYFSDGAGSYRTGIRGGNYVIDKLLVGDWAGTEDTDWTNIYLIS